MSKATIPLSSDPFWAVVEPDAGEEWERGTFSSREEALAVANGLADDNPGQVYAILECSLAWKLDEVIGRWSAARKQQGEEPKS